MLECPPGSINILQPGLVMVRTINLDLASSLQNVMGGGGGGAEVPTVEYHLGGGGHSSVT